MFISSYPTLPKRVFKSPLVEFANFEDGSTINLIRLNKPYKNGISYAVHETTKSPFCSNGLFKTLEGAKLKFENCINYGSRESKLIKRVITNN